MDGVERRYKVKERRQYQEKYIDEKTDAKLWGFVCGLSAVACAATGIATAIEIFNSVPLDLYLPASSVLMGCTAKRYFVDLVKSISKLTILEVDIEKLTTEIENYDQESVGRRR